jgi:hypothetical protein
MAGNPLESEGKRRVEVVQQVVKDGYKQKEVSRNQFIRLLETESDVLEGEITAYRTSLTELIQLLMRVERAEDNRSQRVKKWLNIKTGQLSYSTEDKRAGFMPVELEEGEETSPVEAEDLADRVELNNFQWESITEELERNYTHLLKEAMEALEENIVKYEKVLDSENHEFKILKYYRLDRIPGEDEEEQEDLELPILYFEKMEKPQMGFAIPIFKEEPSAQDTE